MYINKKISCRRFIFLVLYYGLLRYFPCSSTPIVGNFSKKMRYLCCRNIFKKCGKNVNVERMAYFASGLSVEIGDNSGLGINCHIPSDTIIGNNVMMGPNCYILSLNHKFDRTDVPMIFQGVDSPKQVIIEDDVWIGRDVLFTPGRIVRKGSIVAGGCVLSKDFSSYSVIGGNPSRLLKKRK